MSNLFKRRSVKETDRVLVYSCTPVYLIVNQDGDLYVKSTVDNCYRVRVFTNKEEAEDNCPNGHKVISRHLDSFVKIDTLANFINEIQI